jgi:SAM-dependent methyltransferase
MSHGVHIERLDWDMGRREARLQLMLLDDILFDVDLNIQLLRPDGACVLTRHASQSGWDITWLPGGSYRLVVRPDLSRVAPGSYRLRFVISSDAGSKPVHHALAERDIRINDAGQAGRLAQDAWELERPDGLDLSRLSWRKGSSDWFFLHFDHAARVIIDLLLARDPRLKGDILDVGCGDGVTDLGVFLRCKPASLTGVDPFKGYERLPEIVEENLLPATVLDDPRLRFEPHSANELPYPDDHFDVVLSWGSLEHIAGGYQRALQEIRRVLKPGGLFFVHPGLFYSTTGNHLGEFFDDPFIHLKIPEDELKQRVLSTQPRYMDRAGYFAEPADYWRWYTELNRITVPQMEKELRGLGFEPWRVALRAADLVEYTPELQRYSMDQLAITELYASFELRADQSSG